MEGELFARDGFGVGDVDVGDGEAGFEGGKGGEHAQFLNFEF